jgi:hypothetical protein
MKIEKSSGILPTRAVLRTFRVPHRGYGIVRSNEGRYEINPLSAVRFGSLADMATGQRDVRFTPESGHLQCTSACPLSAKSGQAVLPELQHRQISGGEIGCPCRPPHRQCPPSGLSMI